MKVIIRLIIIYIKVMYFNEDSTTYHLEIKKNYMYKSRSEFLKKNNKRKYNIIK